MFENEKFIDHNIAELCMQYDKIHGVNINIARITPDFCDGLKPVLRRALYIMYLMNKDKGRQFRKMAAISGDTAARLHHHSTTAISDAVVGSAQPWKNSIPLVDIQGSLGSVSGEKPGADRYIYGKLSNYAYDCFFADFEDSVVDMIMGADEDTLEPVSLPSKYPNILLNGTLGIGYGLACNIPSMCFKEVVDATIELIHNPEANIILIPDSPSGCDIIQGDFYKLTNNSIGFYKMRCKFDIDATNNIVSIIALPYGVEGDSVVARIAEVKTNGNEFPELVDMEDLSTENINIRLQLRNDANPYKFIKKLIKNVGGLEKAYPMNLNISNEYRIHELTLKELLLEWIKYRREQQRVVINYRRTVLQGEQRTNDVKIFLMRPENLDRTIKIFKDSNNKQEIEHRLIEEYRNSEIHMDSIQAKTLAEMRMYHLSKDEYKKCLDRQEELIKELDIVDDILKNPKGIDSVIISQLREGMKKYGVPRRSNIVPQELSFDNEIDGHCILNLSSDGKIIRQACSDVEDIEPVPTDSSGFAVQVGNDDSFIIVDEDGLFSFIRVKELPIDEETSIHRYLKQPLGKIVAMIPFSFESKLSCVLISEQGMIKKVMINQMTPSKRPCIGLENGDKLLGSIIVKPKSVRDILVYTKEGMGQRIDPNDLRITSTLSKGWLGFKLPKDDKIVGCYSINPKENQYLFYMTAKGKGRLNIIDYLPARNSKQEKMVRLININNRDELISIIGCNRTDKVQVFYQDGKSETIELEHLREETMSSEPKKLTERDAVSNSIVKVKLL